MNLKTGVRDCLCLNWALPRESLAEPEAPLRFDVCGWRGGDWVFASALLFRVERLRVESVALPRLSFPQFILRLCVVDGDSIPSYLIACVLAPPWAVPGARWVGGQPATRAAFHYPPAGLTLGEEGRRWEVRRRARFSVHAAPGAAAPGLGPELGGWERTVSYFHRRPRSYYRAADGLRRLEIEPRSAAAVPVTARIERSDLASRCLDLENAEWPALHSGWFWPEVAFLFEWEVAGEAALPRRVPAPG